MGGHENGEVASRSVCNSFASFLENVPPNEFDEVMFDCALSFAFDELDRQDDCPDQTKKMGTTLAFLYLNEQQALMAHIGDSRIYHFRKNGKGQVDIIYKSSDHSLVSELLNAGVITEEEAIVHPKRNVITRCIQPNMERRCRAEVHTEQDVKEGDRFFLCSDGITESLTDLQLCAIAAENDSDEAMINAIRKVCEAHSHDNFSAWLVTVTEGNQSM